MKQKIFAYMDWVANPWGQYGCSSPSSKVLHGSNLLFDSSLTAKSIHNLWQRH